MSRARPATIRAWVAKNRGRVRATHARWRAANVVTVLRKSRRANWKKYGINPDAAEALLAAHNNGHCQICGAREPGGTGGWHVDHDHKTKTLRGILCSACNRALGYFRDNADILEAAVRYLRFYA